jgi:carboxymethylenebutenolidase
MSTKQTSPIRAPHYIARPATAGGRGVLVLHPWWGLNAFIRGLCDRLATEGFIALAPDLYQGRVATTIAEAEALMSTLSNKAAAQDVLQAAQHLATMGDSPGIGVIGFSMGGYWGLWLATQPEVQAKAVVVFYGDGEGDFSASQAAFQFHDAESDPYSDAGFVAKLHQSLAAAKREVEYHTYAGTGHWFFESDRVDAYNAPAAELAWERTLAFLRSHL